MIPILYAGNEQQFLSNGLGRLSDAIKCTVEEERNGTFELEMEYPISGIHYADLAVNKIILAKTEDGGQNQAFIIYKISRPLNGIVTINAEHISYLLNGFVVMPFTAVSCADAFSKIANNIVLTTPFEFHTDVTSTKSFTLSEPKAVRAMLGGEQGSILDTYGGYDYKFDNFSVWLYQDRGYDNGVTIRYGKNLTALKDTNDTTNVYTGIVPFWQAEDQEPVYLPEKVVYSDHADDYPYKIIKTVDFSSEFETAPTVAQLRQRAQTYVENNQSWKIKNNIDVSFINLSQTDEYKDFVALERVRLCDTVTVRYDALGVDVKTKVIKTTYNVLTEKYDEISLGDTTYTLAQAIQGTLDNPTVEEVSGSIKSAVARATKLIQGGLGGHVVFNTNGDGEPQEILIMDTDDIATAVNVIRMNLNGIGFSHNGYNGPFETAWTIDGHFVANFIDTGELNGNLIQANTISASALTLAAKEELVSKHDYIGTAPFTDISKWEYGSDAVAPYFETINGKKYVVLDGTGLADFSSAAWARVPTDLIGRCKLDFHFVYHIDRAVTISQNQRFPHVYYETPTNYTSTWEWLPAQSIPADTDFTWDVSITPLNTIDTTKYSPRVGLYYIQGCKIYLEVFEVTSTVDAYSGAGMEFNAKGLSLAVSEIEDNNTHNYVPTNIFISTGRWTQIVKQSGTGTIGISTDEISVGGVTYPAIKFDATNYTGGEVYYAFNTDLIGESKFDYSFKFQLDQTMTFASDTEIFGHTYVGGYAGHPEEWSWNSRITAGTTINANTQYSRSSSYTTGDVDYYYKTPQFWFRVIPGAVIYYYDIKITGEETLYKKASLTYTADGLNSVVQAGSVISSINQSAEEVEISANRINLTGDLSLRGDFKSYDANDNTTYAFMDSASVSFFNQGSNVFTVASIPLLGNNAGIFFGDADDAQTLIRYSYLTQEFFQTPTLLVRKDGSQMTPTGAGQALVEGDFSVYGSSSFYGNVYNDSGTVVFVSDQRKKNSIKDLVLEKTKSFLMALKPRMFKFNNGTSDRFHHGFIAQEVREVMPEDWGLYCEDQKTDFIGLRYDELFADMVAVIQDQEKRIQALERKVNGNNTIVQS